MLRLREAVRSDAEAVAVDAAWDTISIFAVDD